MSLSDAPLITHLYAADPSAHVFEGKLYLYPSHDRDTDCLENDQGDQYDMADYHVFSMDEIGGAVVDHGVALALSDIPWAGKQLWAPDAASKDGRYYFYFPARDKEGVFRIGVAVGDKPTGPFRAEPAPIKGSYSIDPCSFVDGDGRAYLYFGGLWGGQLQKWRDNGFDPEGNEPRDEAPALSPRVAELAGNMTEFAGPVRGVQILDEDGAPLRAGDHDRRFFEGAWMHKREGIYYLSYSTGNTHYIAYATADNPLGPFTYAGRLLEPVIGWTTHHSIVEFKGRWYLFYHDASLSGGCSHLRCIKLKELVYDESGKMKVRIPALSDCAV
ncbi:MAG: Xylosidase/arabinosidase [Verrucomicrobiota bacterium]